MGRFPVSRERLNCMWRYLANFSQEGDEISKQSLYLEKGDYMKPLMVSISGVRGVVGQSLTPEVLMNYAAAFGLLCRGCKIVVGRDSRVSGEMARHAVLSGLLSAGCSVVDLGMVPTPTAQMAVEELRAAGGMVITASHNPQQWNGLKFIGPGGLFLGPKQSARLWRLARQQKRTWVSWDRLGHLSEDAEAIERHVGKILSLPDIEVGKLRKRKFRVVVDCVNGVGGLIVPRLLRELGCRVTEIHTQPTGRFAHPPEPLPENLAQLCKAVRRAKADIGFATDPDVDRLAVVDERGRPLGEEYTLVLAVQFVLKRRPGRVVINMSTTRAVEDIAREFEASVIRTPVGEIHVARRMRRSRAVIGGEGNGGVILPELHLGRDAPVGMALILQNLLECGGTVSQMVAELPRYVMIKRKMRVPREKMGLVERSIAAQFRGRKINRADGVRVDLPTSWVHVRRSNTEPIVRIYTEARTRMEALALSRDVTKRVKTTLGRLDSRSRGK
jgi:phosphomannomutase